MPKVVVPRDVLEAELAEYLAAGPTEPVAAYEGAARHRVLPLMSDFMGCWALDLNGQLVVFSWDAPDTLERVVGRSHEQVGINAALALGSDRYARLASIRPLRPADASPCTSCDGRGRLPGLPENIICACAGLGWLPAGSEHGGT